MQSTSCPDQHVLEKLLLGQLPEAEAIPLEEHLSSCERCVEAANRLSTNDPLVEAMRAGSALCDAADEESVSRLIPQIKSLRTGSKSAEPELSADTGTDEADQDSGTGDDAEIEDLLAPAEQADEIGRLGGYRVLELLGSGGMGVVFKARDSQLNRLVALKTVKRALAASKSARQRFLREARASAAIEHDHIATIYQVGEDRGVPFLAMQLLKGESLAGRIKRQPVLPVTQVLRIGREVAQGLAAAHQQGLLHRDIKPHNIWLEAPNDRVKIVDFGLARAMESDSVLTHTGAIIGTPEYMAPEQAKGEPVDHRSDLFSLGCVVYRLATGKAAFSGPNVTSKLMAVSHEDPTPPQELNPELPAPVADLITKLLAKNPDARYQSAEQVIAAIEALEQQLAREETVAPQEIAEEATEKRETRQRPTLVVPPRYRRPLAIAAAAIPLAALFGILIYLSTGNGVLVIQSEVDDVEITITQSGKTVQTMEVSTDGKTIHLRSGQYDIGFAGTATDRLQIDNDRVTLRRGERTVVKIERQLAARDAKPAVGPGPQPHPVLPEAGDARRVKRPTDRPEPFVIVAASGEQRAAFKSFQQALAAFRDGETLQVHSDGPFTVSEDVFVRDKGLTLEAAPGFRPQFHCTAGFHVDGGPCIVRGCEFRSQGSVGVTFFGGRAPRFEFHGCRFFGDFLVAHTQAVEGAKLLVSDCLMWNSGANGVFNLGARSESELSNNVVRTRMGRFIWLEPANGQILRMRNNTFCHLGGPMITYFNFDKSEFQAIQIEATGNVFDANTGMIGLPSTDELRSRFHWRGSHNLYVGDNAPFSYGDQTHVNGLADWNKIWGREEEGSQAVKRVFYRWQELSFSDAPFARRTIEDVILEAKEQYGIQVGPTWELVGPGDGYVRELAAQGEELTDDQLRPQPRDGFPFLVLRAGKPSGHYVTLQGALNAAIDGDTVEIRANGPFPPASREKAKEGIRLTLRSAPGYHPVLEGDLVFHAEDEVTIEGIDFANGAILSRDDVNHVPPFRLVRLANCSFATESEFAFLARCGNAETKRTEIVNCLIPRAAYCILPPNAQMQVVNSVIGTVYPRLPHQGERNLQIERSVIWSSARSPHGDVGTCISHFPEDDDPNQQGGSLLVSSKESLFEVFNALLVSAPARWEGTSNVYRVGVNRWIDRQALPAVGIYGLQLLLNSPEPGSVVMDPLSYDPLQWRLLPGSPGAGEGPDGRDFGADVDRISAGLVPASAGKTGTQLPFP